MVQEQGLLPILDRYCGKIYPSKESFLRKAKEDKILIYLGIDPTGPDLHLGHSTNLLVLKKLQELGHTVILLVGDFTARIGDPTDRQAARRKLSREEVLANAATYQDQAAKLLDFEGQPPALLKFNSQWLANLPAAEMIELAAHVTVDQLRKRRMFKQRQSSGKEVYLHEFLYPLLQAYDSVFMGVDAEIGGTDQTFNMLLGRDLVKSYSRREKYVLTTQLLEDPQTGKKMMSKSGGNYVSLRDKPEDMYAKVMALPDRVIVTCLRLCTMLPMAEIEKYKKQLAKGQNPMRIKKVLARTIVKMYHGTRQAQQAEKYFEETVQAGQAPLDKIEEKEISGHQWVVEDLLVELGLAQSKSEAKRLVRQGGVEIDGSRPRVQGSKLKIEDGTVVRVGKRRFIRVRIYER